MYPGIALFYPNLARAVLEYRVRTIDGARDNAQRQGYKVGATYATGLNKCGCVQVCAFSNHVLDT